VGVVVFSAVLSQFGLLVLHQDVVDLLQIADLQVQAVDHALELGHVTGGLADLGTDFFDLGHSAIELLAELVGLLDELLPLSVHDADAGVLGIALLLPLGEGAIALVDGALLSVSEFLLTLDIGLEIIVLTFAGLVMRHHGLDLLGGIADVPLDLSDLYLDSLGLVLNLPGFLLLVLVLPPQNVQFVVQTFDYFLLADQLGFEISSEGLCTDLHGILPSLKVLNPRQELGEVPFVDLVGLDLFSIGPDDAVSDGPTHLSHLVHFLGLHLHPLIFVGLSALSISLVLLILRVPCVSLERPLLRGFDLSVVGWDSLRRL
jgi:hypothetical protein